MESLIPNLMLVGLHSETYWIRLAVQRVYGSLFQTQMRDPHLSVSAALGLSEAGELSDHLYKLASVFSFRHMLTDELGTQLVKNLTYLLRHADPSCLPRLFSRCSFLARKMMLNVSVAKDKIAHVLLFFQVALHLFESQAEGQQDNACTRAVLTPVLELVYRIYTDEQYAESRARELSSEIVDYLSAGLDKAFFITTYNSVKAGIQAKRVERRRQQKVLLATDQGAKLKEKKRARKAEKKREKKRAKIMHYELRKN